VPRVSEEYRAARRGEILAAAAGLFAHNGFHATSMADIFAESGMSAGAVYRYFRSKEEIVVAVAETVLANADEVFARLLADGAAPSPAETVRAVIAAILERGGQGPVAGPEFTRIAIQVWGEASRSEELRERVGGAFTQVRAHYTEVARRWQEAGRLPADADLEQVGSAMLGLTQGFLLQSLLIPGTTPEGYIAGVEALLG
jgi:AcrR family transcriptional regulator